MSSVFSSEDVKGLCDYIAREKPKNIIVMVGAGASVAAGIPDFRTPGVGLYSLVAEKYPALAARPEALFSIPLLKENPSMFYNVASQMNLWPDAYKPTDVHKLIKLLEDKGLLLRCYTQNIDTLERSAGVSDDKLVEAHGSFAAAHCIDCKKAYSCEWVEKIAKGGAVPRCTDPRRVAENTSICDGIVKPDVVFFGEALPPRFFQMAQKDLPKCDLLLIIGTSLQVHPFAGLPSGVPSSTPRVLINMNRCGPFSKSGSGSDEDEGGDDSDSEAEAGTKKEASKRNRDLFIGGDCQQTAREIMSLAFNLSVSGAEDTVNKKESNEDAKLSEVLASTRQKAE